MKTETRFNPMIDRYHFDFNQCSISNGYAQVDTGQDASYYGNWANPEKFIMVEYCEGDITIKTAANPSEFAGAMREFVEWANKSSRFIGIDPGFNEKIKNQFNQLGLGHLLH